MNTIQLSVCSVSLGVSYTDIMRLIFPLCVEAYKPCHAESVFGFVEL